VNDSLKETIVELVSSVREAGLYPEDRIISSTQGAAIIVSQREVINMSSNNYLGLAGHPDIIKAAHDALDQRGFGMASVRLACGTQDLHSDLEERISGYLGKESSLLHSSCWDANTGLFSGLLDENDVIISDELNHASIIDGIRLSKARSEVFKHNDMDDLEKYLKATGDYRCRLIATDGVFSMDGEYASLDKICRLADRYRATVMVDDSHATGFVGKTGRGTPEIFDVMDRIDIITSTFGKALGGASGGFISGPRYMIDLLRLTSRPFMFSNSVAPPIVKASLAAIDLVEKSDELRKKLMKNTQFFRQQMGSLGFNIIESDHPIVPIILGEDKLAHDMAHDLMEEGVYVVGMRYPVVPPGQARIRAQISAAHSLHQLEHVVESFVKIGKKYNAI